MMNAKVAVLSCFAALSIQLSSTYALSNDGSPPSWYLKAMKFAEETGTDPSDLAQILVNPGDKNSAVAYYDQIGKKITFDIGKSTLDGLLEYIGYGGLQAIDLELIASDELMPKDANALAVLSKQVQNPTAFGKNTNFSLPNFKRNAVLASRFFAPKIVDFNAAPVNKNGFDKHTPGWRKLIRLTAMPNSKAFTKGNIKFAYILFNYFQPDPASGPFPINLKELSKKQSVNNQVILVPQTFRKDLDDSVYFLDYDTFQKKYNVSFALNAAFDTPFPGDKKTKQDYFVPIACAQCHGHDVEFGLPSAAGNYSYGKINYLDTDQWYDMMAFDFPETGKKFDALFDGGFDHKSISYQNAVATVWKLNKEIEAQNTTALHPKAPDEFKIRAVKKWLALHAKGEGPIDPLRRSIGKTPWKKAELPLLNALDRFCFRCHSSMYYNVFDRNLVLKQKKGPNGTDGIIDFVKNGIMPQGRKLEQKEKDDLVRYLTNLK